MHRLQDAGRDSRAADRLSASPPALHEKPGQHARPTNVVGRFAPSPSGALHAGSLIAALASHASARAAGGRWHIRIDDLDTPRVMRGAAPAILRTLQQFGFADSHTPVQRQSERLPRYYAALAQLAEQGLLFRCGCSRRSLAGTPLYPGHCRERRIGAAELARWLTGGTAPDEALRARLSGALVLDDAVQGERRVDLDREVGDLVVLRRDGIVAWPLATACDDAAPVNEVVRGADLFGPTPAQLAMMHRLSLTPPRYAHVPVLVDADRRKLGKSTQAAPIDACDDESDRLALLQRAWRFLGQSPIVATTLPDFHAATARQWSMSAVPRCEWLHHEALASWHGIA